MKGGCIRKVRSFFVFLKCLGYWVLYIGDFEFIFVGKIGLLVKYFLKGYFLEV